MFVVNHTNGIEIMDADSLDDFGLDRIVESAPRRISSFAFCMIIVNGLVGNEFLAFGRSFKHGIGITLFLHAMTCVLTYIGSVMLFWNAQQISGFSHEEIWISAFGRRTVFIPCFLLLSFDLSFVEIYTARMIECYELLCGHGTSTWTTDFVHNKLFLTLCVWLVSVFPMSFVSDVRFLLFPAMIAFMCITTHTVYNAYMFVGQYQYNGNVLDPTGQMVWASSQGIVELLQNSLLAYTYVPLVFVATGCMRSSEISFNALSQMSVAPLTVTFGVCQIAGLLSYLTLYDKLDSRMYIAFFLEETDEWFTGPSMLHRVMLGVVIVLMWASIFTYVVAFGGAFSRMAGSESIKGNRIAIVAKTIGSLVAMIAACWNDVAGEIATFLINLCSILLCYAYVPVVTLVFRGLETMLLFFVTLIFLILSGLLAIFLFR